MAGTKWEYRVEPLPRADGLVARFSSRRRVNVRSGMQSWLNVIGNDGWELVHVREDGRDLLIGIFKRPRAEA